MIDKEIAGFTFGNPLYIDDNNKWRMVENDELTYNVDESKLICPHCELHPTEDGHDPCIKNLADVDYACCGHGISGFGTQAYIKYKNGKTIYFHTTEEILEYINKE